jgi:hypothetical protein
VTVPVRRDDHESSYFSANSQGGNNDAHTVRHDALGQITYGNLVE